MAWAAAALCGLLLGAAGPAPADVNPPGCGEHRFDLHLSREPGTVNNGDTVTYTVSVCNGEFPPACQVTDMEVRFYPPGPDGLPDMAAGMLLAPSGSHDPGSSLTYPFVPVTLALDPGVTLATARATYRGLLQDAMTPHLIEGAREVSVCVLPHSCDGAPAGCGGNTCQLYLSRVPTLAHNGATIAYTVSAVNGSFPPACQVSDTEVWLYPPGAERDLLMRLAEVERRHKTRVEEMFSQAAFPESF